MGSLTSLAACHQGLAPCVRPGISARDTAYMVVSSSLVRLAAVVSLDHAVAVGCTLLGAAWIRVPSCGCRKAAQVLSGCVGTWGILVPGCPAERRIPDCFCITVHCADMRRVLQVACMMCPTGWCICWPCQTVQVYAVQAVCRGSWRLVASSQCAVACTYGPQALPIWVSVCAIAGSADFWQPDGRGCD